MLVSILIPCFNAERWIGHAIESALTQSYPHKEVLVVDDGSTDDSLAIIQSFEGAIRYESIANGGANRARNRLMSMSQGEWLQYLDADDYLLPDKISSQIAFVAGNPKTDVVFGPVVVEDWLGAQGKRRNLKISEPCDPWVLLARWELPQTGSPLWRRRALLDVGGWKPDQPCCQEHELYLRLLMAGKRFDYCAAAGAVYRLWSDETLCRRDMRQVHRRRLDITAALESHLRSSGQLTRERQTAINQSRFEIARAMWQYEPAMAGAIITEVHASQSRFSPVGSAAPFLYRLFYHSLGFGVTEAIAGWRRTMLAKFS